MQGWRSLDTYCQEAGRELASNDLVAKLWKETRWPGRLEIVSSDPLLLLDGAHNPMLSGPCWQLCKNALRIIIRKFLYLYQTKALGDMLDLLETIDSQLTLTHFDDSRATDEKRAERDSQV